MFAKRNILEPIKRDEAAESAIQSFIEEGKINKRTEKQLEKVRKLDSIRKKTSSKQITRLLRNYSTVQLVGQQSVRTAPLTESQRTLINKFNIFILLSPPLDLYFSLKTIKFEKHRMYLAIRILKSDFLYKELFDKHVHLKTSYRQISNRFQNCFQQMINFSRIQNQYLGNLQAQDLTDYTLNSCIKIREYLTHIKETMNFIASHEIQIEDMRDALHHSMERLDDKLHRLSLQHETITTNQLKSPFLTDLEKQDGILKHIDAILNAANAKVKNFEQYERQKERFRENNRVLDACEATIQHMVSLLKSMQSAWTSILSSQEQLKGMILVFSYFLPELVSIEPLLVERWTELENLLEAYLHIVKMGSKRSLDDIIQSLKQQRSETKKKVDHEHISSIHY